MWDMVDIKADSEMVNTVSLPEIKSNPVLSEMALVKLSRLSVSSVREAEWKTILELGQPKKLR